MTNEEQKSYEMPPDSFWSMAFMFGGYEMMEKAERRKWNAIAGWGKDGYDLGSWPYVIIFFRNVRKEDKSVSYQLAYYCEGDVTQYAFPTKELRDECTDGIAFFHWKNRGEDAPWVKGYDTVEQLPLELRGPYRD